jgi:Trk K+ transport system NAD-binding subunit
MASGKILLVGAGNIGQLLIQLIDEDVDLVCIDRVQANLDRAMELRPQGLMVVCGDATSRLQLEELGLDDIDTVIASSTSERVNIEVARVVKDHFDVPQVIAVGITHSGIELLKELDAEVEDIFHLSASGIINRLESKSKTAIGIGLGRNEILQVEVHPDSRLVNKRLSLFHANKWRIGIIYRDEQIIVPRGSTALRPHDKVVLLGDPRAIHTLAERLAFRFTSFPLEFGDTLVVSTPRSLDPAFLDEIRYLCELLPVEKLLAVVGSSEWQEPLQSIAKACGMKSCEVVASKGGLDELPALCSSLNVHPALLVLSRAQVLRSGLPLLQGLRSKRQLLRLAESLGCPLLLASGQFPYEKTAVASLSPQSLERSLEIALEFSTLAHFALEVLAVAPSEYLDSEDEDDAVEAMEKIVAYLARTYKKDIPERPLEGNPILAIGAALAGQQLLVVDMEAWQKPTVLRAFLTPDTGWEVVRRASLSCLLIPPGAVFE